MCVCVKKRVYVNGSVCKSKGIRVREIVRDSVLESGGEGMREKEGEIVRESMLESE